ncbi:MAG: DUF362 domain-containing protein [Nanoarchaeota archaeon]|nr:DUF362 domain-containing protein [Nanoarchaeota archaeon]
MDVLFSKDFDKLLEKIDFSKLGKNIAIKVHFGEKGCDTYMNPELVKKIYQKISSIGKKATLVECNVLYKGERTQSSSHIKLAKEHGFDFAPIDILDGELGQNFIEIKGCKIGEGIKKYDSLVVISHFKGHMMAGFGGAIKNLGMGLGSRAGKLAMHSNIKPHISKKCTGCGICIQNCNAKAISLIEGKSEINPNKCEGCAVCISVCPEGAVLIPWASETSEGLQRKIVDYASAVISLFNNIIFINLLENITPDCDCMGKKQNPVIKNIGFIKGNNIVAVDKASLDLANKNGFQKVQPNINKNIQIDYAIKKGLGEKEYNLIQI